jgi:hypothetical protein
VVSGEQRTMLVEREAHVVRGVAGREHRTQRPAVSLRCDVTVGDANVGVELEVDGLLDLDPHLSRLAAARVGDIGSGGCHRRFDVVELGDLADIALVAAVRPERDRRRAGLRAQPRRER